MVLFAVLLDDVDDSGGVIENDADLKECLLDHQSQSVQSDLIEFAKMTEDGQN